MQRFILQQNVERFRAALGGALPEAERRQVRAMLADAERELALLNCALTGVQVRPSLASAPDEADRAAAVDRFHKEFARATTPALLVDPAPGLSIVDVNAPYERVSGQSREHLVGQPLFLIFPDNPDDPTAHGVSDVYASLKRAAETGRPDETPVARYDVRDEDGRFVERYWRQVNTPVHDEYGRLIYLLHQVEEVTGDVPAPPRSTRESAA